MRRGAKVDLIEIKTQKGKLNAEQRTFHQSWHGQICVVRSAREALIAVGVL